MISNQNQIIEKLKQDLAATKKVQLFQLVICLDLTQFSQQINRKQAAQLEKLKESSKRDEEVILSPTFLRFYWTPTSLDATGSAIKYPVSDLFGAND